MVSQSAQSPEADGPDASGAWAGASDQASGAARAADEALVAALVAHRPNAMGDLYEAYANRVYSYAMSIVRGPDRAADVTHDSIIVACERIDQLRDPAKLKPWLYAICRNLCLRDLRAAGRVVPLAQVMGDEAQTPDQSVDLDAGLDAAGARELVEDALAGMSDADREILELGLRHQLDTREIAPVLGISEANARARMARSRSQLEGAITALLLFRQRRSGCTQLRQAASGDRFTPLVRKRIARHARSCDLCRRDRKRAVRAIAIAALPLLVAPAALKTITLDQPQLVAAATPYDPQSPVATIRFDASGWAAHSVVAPMKAAIGIVAGAAVLGVGIVILSSGWPGFSPVGPAGEAAADNPAGAETAAMPASRPAPARKKHRPPSPRPTARSWSTSSSSGSWGGSGASNYGSFGPSQPTRTPAKRKPKPTQSASPSPSSSPTSPTPTSSPTEPPVTPTPTPTESPPPPPPPAYCTYDPGAPGDYNPGGPGCYP